MSGKETEDIYIIHPNLGAKLSLQVQRAYLNRFDIDYFLALAQNGENFREFAPYVVDNGKREIIEQYLRTYNEQTQVGSSQKK